MLTVGTLGPTLGDLLTIYHVRFPVLCQYDTDTSHEAKARIVSTPAEEALPGVGIPGLAATRDTCYAICSPASSRTSVASAITGRHDLFSTPRFQ